MKVIIVRDDGTKRTFDLTGKRHVIEKLATSKALQNPNKPYSFLVASIAYEAEKELTKMEQHE